MTETLSHFIRNLNLRHFYFSGICVISLLIGLCYDWRHQKKCFKHVTDQKIIDERRHRRISKSEPRSPTPPSIPLPIIKPKGPPPPPPLTIPYLPPMRSQSQPPNNRVISPPPPSIPPKPEFRISRPSDPPPPVPMSPPRTSNGIPGVPNGQSGVLTSPPGVPNGPPVVPYGTRPHISEVAYLKKKFEDGNVSNDSSAT